MSRVKTVRDTDYLALSMRVRVMELRLLTRERMDRMIDAKDLSEAAKVLSECGYGELREITPSALEEMLAEAQAEMFRDLGRGMDNTAILDVFRCKYDYHNAKVLVKSGALEKDFDRLLLGGGRYAPDALAEDFRGKGLGSYPKIFAQGVARAQEALAASGDPQLADLILDRAYFEELTQLAESSGSKFLRGYAALLIDSANLRAAVRAGRLGKGAEFLSLVLADGGTVSASAVAAARGEALSALYRSTPLAEAAAAGAAVSAPGSGALTEFERLCDDAVTSYVVEGRRVPFGEQPIAAYLYAREAEQTAIRIIMNGRMAGLDGKVLRQRLRRPCA